MKFVLAVHGTRGDVEPCATVGLELQRRGHDVRMAVSPDQIGFVESVGLAAVAYGADSREDMDDDLASNFWMMRNPASFVRRFKHFVTRGWADMSTTLTSLADGADLLLTGQINQETVANIAEYYDIPLVTLHYFPMRPNGQIALPSVPSPAPLVRSTMTLLDWLFWRITKEAEDAQRRDLGLPEASSSSPRRIAASGSLEIQAYDEVCFPGLAAEWDERRPFVGALTMELPTNADEDVASWIAAGTAPIYFSFGSASLESSAVTMIAAACRELGERALIYCDESDSHGVPNPQHVKLVGPVSYATVLPACRAVIHHGGAGTTAASLRAGIPTLILWSTADQPIWAAAVKGLKVGSARRLAATTTKTLVTDLRSILAPQCVTRARELATRLTKPAASVAAAADLVEHEARQRCFGGSSTKSPGRS